MIPYIKNILSSHIKHYVLLLIISVTISACAQQQEILDKEVSGNSFDPWNARADGYGTDATSISVSYWFKFNNKETIIDQYSGKTPLWFYIDRLNPQPLRGLIINWIPRTSPLIFDDIIGGRFSTIVKNRRTYGAYEYCLSAETVRRLPLLTYNYGIIGVNHNVGKTGQLYVKRFIPRNLEEDGSRIDIIYLEDIGLSGFRCVDLANFEPVDSPTTALLQRLNSSADQSFDVQ